MWLSNNHLSGNLLEFPNTSSSKLKAHDLGSNNLQGPIPMSIFKLRTFGSLSFSFNKFNGTINIDMVKRLANLSTLDLSYNNLSIVASDSHEHSSSLFRNIRFPRIHVHVIVDHQIYFFCLLHPQFYFRFDIQGRVLSYLIYPSN